jgi:hypothetical protein
MTMKSSTFALVCCLTGCVVVVCAAAIQEIKLADGYDPNNRIVTPLYESPGVSVELAVTGTVQPKTKFVRRTGGRLPATRGPEYDLDAKVNLGALLTEALRTEALAMGLNRAGSSERQWRVSGTIKDIFLESRQIYMGATLFYGYLDLELAVTNPGGESRTVRMRVHNYSGGYNAGFGRRDEAESGAAHLLVEGAQEILAQLNREFFKVRPNAGMSDKLTGLQAGPKEKLGDLRMVGLSGLPAAVPSLLGWLAKEQDENLRSALVDALALLGSSDAVATLSARYATEDEDVRWYTLKAMDYIGGEEANRVINGSGMKDKDAAPKRLARRITKTER